MKILARRRHILTIGVALSRAMTVAVAAEDALVQPPGGAEYAIGTSLIVGEFDGRPVEKDPDCTPSAPMGQI